MSGSNWRSEDDKPFEVWMAELEAKYGKKLAKVIAGYRPRPRKNPSLAWAKHNRERRVHLRGNPERGDAPAAAVDFRHHRARIERGK